LNDTDSRSIGDNGRPDIGEALHRARLTQAAHLEAVSEVHGIERLRLELLADALEPVFASIPAGNEHIAPALVAGSPPRLWLDMVAFVEMGDDRRVYRLVQCTRSERRVLHETPDLQTMAQHVTDYIAHRLVEREQALEEANGAAPVGARGGYSTAALILAWICGFAVGVLGLYIAGVLVRGV